MSNYQTLVAIYERTHDLALKASILECINDTMLPSTASSDSYVPPLAVRTAAKKGLELRKAAPKSKKGGLTQKEASKQGIGSGVARAAQLASGRGVSLETIKRMVSFFARHQKNYDKGGERAKIAWLLWGGNAGKAWANGIAKKQSKSMYISSSSLFDIKYADWYQYVGSKPVSLGELNQKPLLLNKNDYFTLGEMIFGQVQIYTQNLPKVIGSVGYQTAAYLLRTSRPLTIRESFYKNRLGNRFI
jgi:hypothetical protein